MIGKLKPNSNWYLITIDDPKFLKGESIFNIIQLLSKNFNFVILNDIEGSGKKNGVVLSLQENENNILKISDFLNVLREVKQFDWGDFFLFKDYPMNWENLEEITYYPPLIKQADTTVRAVDNQYMYIYTPYEEILNIIKENYEIESVTFDSLDNLSYPY